jgi:hypothetical protein
MSDLVEKLRNLAGRRHIDRGHDAVDEALREAADEIERMRSERPYIIGFNDGWEGAHEQQPGDDRPFIPEDRITALEKENAELRKALEPFAKLAGNFVLDVATKRDVDAVWGYNNNTLTYGDFRRARLASTERTETE